MSAFSAVSSSSLFAAFNRAGVARPLGTVLTAALIATLGLVTVPAVEVAEAAAPAKAAVVDSRPDVLSARVAARAQGSRVEAESERSGTSSTWVNPDGTLTTDQYGGPIRFRDAQGGWQDVDLTLVEQADGTVAPKGHPGGLVLAGASKSALGTNKSTSETDAVATSEVKGAQQVSLAWPGLLGKPTLSGTTATYANVKPGVDLVVQALRTGYEQSFVIRDAAALRALQATAGAGAAVSWSLPVKTKGLTAQARADGSVSFTDAKSVVRSVLKAPIAWDATTDPRSGEHASTAPVKLSVAQKGPDRALLTVTPDKAWLGDPARAFPITIDPTYASALWTPNFDTFVQTGYVDDQSSSTELKVGTYDGGVNVARSFLNFPLASIQGKQIKSAYLSLAETWSYSCTARAVNVYSANVATTSARWTAQPAMAPTVYGTLSVAKGFSSSCPNGRISIPVTSFAQASSGSTSVTNGVGLKAASETDSYGWKKFGSLESTAPPYISYTYNRKPNAGSMPTIADAGTYNAISYPWRPQPVMSSIATDPDGNSVRSTIEVHTSTTASSATLKSSCVTVYVASGAAGSCATAVLPDNSTLYARSAVVDDQGLWNGTWSPWKMFRTAQSPPPAPVISCPGYANESWTDTAPTTDVSCTVTSAGAGTNTAVTLIPTIDGVAQPAKATGQVAYSFTLTVPKTSGGHTVKVRAQSASTKTTDVQIGFGYGSAGLSAPAVSPRVTSTGAIKIAAAGPPRGASGVPTAKVKWRAAGSSANELVGWNDATTAPLTVTDNGATGIAVAGSWNTKAETTDTFTDSDPAASGVQPTTLNERVPVLLDVQVCLTYTTGTQCTWSANKTSVLRVPHAFGNGFPTADAGPGQVALFTGEFNTSDTDVTVPGYTGDLSISRSHSTFGNSTAAATDPATNVFGPGWTAQFDGAEAGAAGMQVVDGTTLDGTIALIDADGSALVYGTPTGARRTGATLATGTYVPVDEDTDLSGSVLKVTSNTTITLTDDDGTATTFTATTAPTTGAAGVFAPATVAEPGTVGATSYTRDANGRIIRILAPVPLGVTCPASGTLNPGCRSLRIVYGATTTGSEVAGQVKEIWLDIYDPAKSGGAGMTSVKVAAYGYDTAKRLVSQSDPRSSVAATTYTYDTGNHLTQVASAGQTPVLLTYAGADPKLANITRARPAGDPAGGTSTLASFVYGVPTSGSGLPDLSAAAVAGWAQAKAPTYGAAVFGPEHPVTSTDPAQLVSADWAYADLSYTDQAGYTTNTASFGAGAWQRTSTDYNTQGNEVRSLDAGAIAAVVAGGNPGAANELATTTVYNPTDILATDGTVLNPAGSLITDTYGPARNVALAGTTDGSTVAARPRNQTFYDQGAPNGGKNPATGLGYGLATKTKVSAADPMTGTDLQVVAQTLTGYGPIDGALIGDPTSGWVLGSATTTTKDMDLNGSISAGDITTRSRFDSEGRTVESRQPSGTGTDAGTTMSAFYTTVAQSAPNTACGGKPQWAGLACRTYPAADPSSGAGGASTLPDSTTTGYNLLLQPTTIEEKSGTVTRTTTSTYLADGRADITRITVAGLASSVPQAGTQTLYDTTTGNPTRAIKLDPTTGVPTTVGTTTAYDAWGRTTAFTSDAGDTSSTAYDAAGRVSVITDAMGAVAHTYDGADANGNIERRGQATKLQVTRTGTNPATSPVLTYTGAYDANGALTRQKMPSGIVQDTELDVAGEPKAMSYSGQVTPVTATTDPITGEVTYTPDTPTTAPWLTWGQQNDITGRTAREWTPAGAAFADGASADKLAEVQPYDTGDALGYDRTYTYDRADRLTKIADRTTPVTGVTFDPTNPATTATVGCTIRSYAFTGNAGDNGSRTSSTSTDYPGSDCTTTPGASTTRTLGYDTADRPTTGAAINGGPAGTPYVYDQLGRQTTMPGVDAPDPAKGDITMAYYDTDLPQTITQGGTTTSYTLNTSGRRQVSTTGPTGGAATSTTTRHYTDISDNPTWADTTTTGIGGGTNITRYTQSLDGDLGATIAEDGTATLPLANPHGDNVANVTIPAAQAETTPNTAIGPWSDYIEYGTPRDPDATNAVGGTIGYGWLGAKERSTTTESAGLTLMGDRLYNPVTGRFTSLDPEPGGGATAYAYPTDPINMYDLDGHWWGWRGVRTHFKKHWRTYATVASFAVGGGALGGAFVLYRAYRVVRIARAARAVGFRQFHMRVSRPVAHVAGRIWTRGGRWVPRTRNRARHRVNGNFHYRTTARKGRYGRSSNLEYRQNGHHQHFNFHMTRRRQNGW